MSFAESDSSIDKERIIGLARIIGYCIRGGNCKFVTVSFYKIIKDMFLIKVAVKLFFPCIIFYCSSACIIVSK